MAQAGVPKDDHGDDVLVFVSYSHRDQKAREQLDVHAAQLKREGVAFWFDGNIVPGAELDVGIRRALRKADIFVALASPDYLHSAYCFEKEYGQALRKAQRGKVYVVVALIKQCQWRHTRMAHYKMLPRDAKPVAEWVPRSNAYEDIIDGLREVVKAVRAARAGQPAAPARRAAPKPKRALPMAKARPKPRIAAVKPKKAAPAKVKRVVAKKNAPKRRLAVARPKPKVKPARKPQPRR